MSSVQTIHDEASSIRAMLDPIIQSASLDGQTDAADLLDAAAGAIYLALINLDENLPHAAALGFEEAAQYILEAGYRPGAYERAIQAGVRDLGRIAAVLVS